MESNIKLYPYIRDYKNFKYIPVDLTIHEHSSVVYLTRKQVTAINRLMYGIKMIEKEIDRVITHRDFGDEKVIHSQLSARAKNLIKFKITKPFDEIMLSDVASISSEEWMRCRNLGKTTLHEILSYLDKQGIQHK